MTAVVIGSGVVGLAVARSLALSCSSKLSSIFVLESQGVVGSETSSRNSGVIHSGLYYPEHSLKARHCVDGRKKLYRYLNDRQISHEKCEKLIVSTDDSEFSRNKLRNLLLQARKNGFADDECQLISGQHAMSLEPELSCEEALLCNQTGIVDGHQYMQMLQGDCEEAGVSFVFKCKANGIHIQEPAFAAAGGEGEGRFVIETSQGVINADIVINSGGLKAPCLMRKITGGKFSQELHVPKSIYFAKGSYFRLASDKSPFDRLIYPIPYGDGGGLGVHSTRDTANQLRFGPDVEWLRPPSGHSVTSSNDPYAWEPEVWDTINPPDYYVVDESRGDSFYAEIRKYYPALLDDSLVADYAGIRPKLQGPDVNSAGRSADFVLQDHNTHLIKGLVNLLGVESPGLTSSLSIAESVTKSIQSVLS